MLSTLGNLLAGKEASFVDWRSYKSWWKCLIAPHPLANFQKEIYQSEPRFNGAYSINNLPRFNGAYSTNNIETHWVACYFKYNVCAAVHVGKKFPSKVTYFNSFSIEHVPKKIEKFLYNGNIIANIYRK